MLNAEIRYEKKDGGFCVKEIFGGPQGLKLLGKNREEVDTELRSRGYEPQPMMFKNETGTIFSKLYSIPHNV